MTMATAGTGEQTLRRAIRRVHRPAWLSDRLRALEEQMRVLRSNYNSLELQEVQHGLDVPVELINSLEQCRERIEQVEQEMDVLMAGWDVVIQRREGG